MYATVCSGLLVNYSQAEGHRWTILKRVMYVNNSISAVQYIGIHLDLRFDRGKNAA